MMLKQFMANILYALGITRLGFRLANRQGTARAVNYHKVTDTEKFRRQIQFFKLHFKVMSEQDLRDFLAGKANCQKPGLILTFDDGTATHYEAARILDELGCTGWFFVPTRLVGKKGRLTWDQIRKMSSRHVIGGHTRTHPRLSGKLSSNQLKDEISGCRQDLDLYIRCRSFAWVGGEIYSYSRKAAQFVNKEFEFVFQTCSWPIYPKTSPMHLQRTNIESGNSMKLVLFQLSGIMDLLYIPKRKIVERKTNTR